MNDHRRYVIITPCRNEAKYARRTLDSVVAQSIPPALWVIVDDGSTDETPRILQEYADRHDFIRVVRRKDRGTRAVGPGVVEAFYSGYETITLDDFDYICKLDLDLDLPHRYFETLMERMEAEPRLGSCSGKPFMEGPGNTLIAEHCGSEMSVGASKFYRVACFKQVGGLVRQVMWDAIDCHRARMLGWIVCSWDNEPVFQFVHLRPTGSSHKGVLTGRMRHGYGQYFMGTGLLYTTASSIFRMAHPPYVIGGLAMWWGFVRSMLGRKPRYEAPGFRPFVRRYQWRCLWMGKAKATALTNQEQASQWDPNRAGAVIGESAGR